MEDNIFTNKIIDIIIPGCSSETIELESNDCSSKLTDYTKHKSEIPVLVDLNKFTHLFLVMNFDEEIDLEQLPNTVPETELDEEHIITILYNQLCALNFIHSANIIHRDLKPSNFLIDSNCNVKICNFEMARSLPILSKDNREFKE